MKKAKEEKRVFTLVFIGILTWAFMMLYMATLVAFPSKENPSVNLQPKIDSLTIELEYCSLANETNYAICQELQAECEKWTNSAIRLKRICGVPDTVDLSYRVKCKYHVETRNLVGKHSIFEQKK